MNLKSLFKRNLSVIRTFPKSTKVHFAYLSNTKKFIFANGERESNFLCKLSGKAVKIIWTVVDMVWPVTRFFSCNDSFLKKKKKKKKRRFQLPRNFYAKRSATHDKCCESLGQWVCPHVLLLDLLNNIQQKMKKKKGALLNNNIA